MGELEALTAEHPLHERLAAQHVAALYAAGRQADALAAYERIRARLADELGVPPSPELQQAHLAVLRGEAAAAPARTRTNLPAEVTSFVGRDAEEERRLARRLAVFPVGATVESAAAVGGGFDGLAALVDRSLLQIVPGTAPVRYRMLETIREYGLEKLDGRRARGHPRHPRAPLRRARGDRRAAVAPPRAEALVRAAAGRARERAGRAALAGRAGDARGALRLAVGLLWFWLLSGSQTESLTWLDFALAVPGEGDPADRAIASGIRELGALAEAGDPAATKRRMVELAEGIGELDVTSARCWRWPSRSWC